MAKKKSKPKYGGQPPTPEQKRAQNQGKMVAPSSHPRGQRAPKSVKRKPKR